MVRSDRLSALADPPCPWCLTTLTTARAGNRLGVNRAGGDWYCYKCERTFDRDARFDRDG